MKKKIFFLLSILCAGAMASCTKYGDVKYVDPVFDPTKVEVTLIAPDCTVNNNLAKSSISDKGAVSWAAGDAFYYFTDASKKALTKGDIKTGGKTSSLTLPRINDKYIAAIHSCDNVQPAVSDYTPKSFTFAAVNPVQSGKFAGSLVGYSEASKATDFLNLSMKSATAAIQFVLPADNKVDKVVMVVADKVAGNEINGQAKVDITAATPSAAYAGLYTGAAAGSQYEITVNTAKQAGTFFINTLPVNLANGFSLFLYTGATSKEIKYNDVAADLVAGTVYTVGNLLLVPPEPITLTFTTEDLGVASGWTLSTSEVTQFVSAGSYGDIKIDIPDPGTGSLNGYYLTTGGYISLRNYQARGEGKFILTSKSGMNIKAITMKFTNKNDGIGLYNGEAINNGVQYKFNDVQTSRTIKVGSSSGKTSGQISIYEWEIILQEIVK